MKTKFLAAMLGVGLVAVGCVNTVNERKTAGVPWVNDIAEGKYERSVDQVFNASKTVLARNGTVTRESNLLANTNTVRALEGRVNNREIWIRVESLDPKPTTQVIVQARGSWGGTDQQLTHQLEKEIALELAR